jgi:hypothetical protein
MAVVARPVPPAQPHGDIREVLRGIFFVTGTMGMPGPLPVRFSRNMTIVRTEDRLVLVNTVRLDDRGLAALDRLGKVTDIVRLAANHGSDDPFYADRYRAKVWVLKGQRYTAGFDTRARDTYFSPDVEADEATELPIAGTRLHFIHSEPPEGLLVLPDHGGTVISGDCFQNWAATDERFNWLGSAMMRLMGFMKPHNVGPGWLRQCRPPPQELRAILDRPFANVLPAHGVPVIGRAAELYRAAIERAARSVSS